MPHLLGGDPGRGDRSIDVVGRCQGNICQMLSGAWRPQLVVSVASPFGPVSGDEKLEVGGQKSSCWWPQTVSAIERWLVSGDGSPNPEGVMDGRIFRPNLPSMN
jgi:hypothetical protein